MQCRITVKFSYIYYVIGRDLDIAMYQCYVYTTCIVTKGHLTIYKYKKQLQKIEKKVGMEYQKAYKQG